MGAGENARKRAGCFLRELVGLRSCAAVHRASLGDHLHVGDFHGASHLAAVPGSRGVLAAVAVAVGSRGCGAGSRCDVGHSSGYANRVSDVRFQVLRGHQLDSLRRFGLCAGLFVGLGAGLAGLRPGLARLRRWGLLARLRAGRLSRRLVAGHAIGHQDVPAVPF